jgi:hypothetical protein
VVLGVLGRDPIVEVLERAVSGKTIGNRAIRVKQFASIEQIDHCDILFVAQPASCRQFFRRSRDDPF